MTCLICSGTGWATVPYPDDNGNPVLVAGTCPECIEYNTCPSCDHEDGLMEWGPLRICLYCGFTFDLEAVEAYQAG
jgi:hypothetical protein